MLRNISMKRNVKLLYIVWIIVFALLVILTYKYKSGKEFTQFYGIAETREIVVNSENAVEIKKIHVVPGQAVQKDQLIVELANPELTKNINEISHELDELKVQAVMNNDALLSEIEELKAEKASRISEINYQIKQLQAQYDINRSLTSDLQSLEYDPSETAHSEGGNNPIQIEIERMKTALDLEINPIQIRINMLERKLHSSENPAEIQIQRLGRELNLLLEEKNNLYIFSQVTGIIGSVQCKTGERISPFDPIMTLHKKSPSYIKGFIHESTIANISVGGKVRVISVSDPSYSVIGDVVGIGSRIIEYPRRLRRMLAVQVYGREVRIRIPEGNKFLLGEKVLVRTNPEAKQEAAVFSGNNLLVPEAYTEEFLPFSATVTESPVYPIKVSKGMEDIANIEASGVLYLRDLKKYLVISDTTKNKKPILYLMDELGNVDDWILIHGLKKIDDMEAITEDEEGNIYISCSQSFTKKGRLTEERKLLLRLKRDRAFLRLDKQVCLYDLILNAAARNKKAEWAQFITVGGNEAELNIEGIFHFQGSLYLGFKSPLQNGRAVIIEIPDISMVFDSNRLDENSIRIGNEFDLINRIHGVPSGISALCLHKQNLYILSRADTNNYGESQKSGSLWMYDMEADKLEHIMDFKDLKPEGLACNVEKDEFLIVFDHGRSKPSKIMTWRAEASSAGLQ